MGSEKGQTVRLEEPRNAGDDRLPVRQRLRKLRPAAIDIPRRPVRHPLPELLERRQTVVRLVAGDQAGVDRTDRGADDPVWLDAALVQRLVDACLKCAESTTSLKDQHNLPWLARQMIYPWQPGDRCGDSLRSNCHAGLPKSVGYGFRAAARINFPGANRPIARSIRLRREGQCRSWMLPPPCTGTRPARRVARS